MNGDMNTKFALMDTKLAGIVGDMNTKFALMDTKFAGIDTKFAEQSGKINVLQYQLGAVIILVTVIGGVSIFTGNKLLLTDCSSSSASR